MRLLVTSAGSANGGGYDTVLRFDAEGKLLDPSAPILASPIRAACPLIRRARSSISIVGTIACWRSIASATSCTTLGG